jgi:hypothetical protein
MKTIAQINLETLHFMSSSSPSNEADKIAPRNPT